VVKAGIGRRVSNSAGGRAVGVKWNGKKLRASDKKGRAGVVYSSLQEQKVPRGGGKKHSIVKGGKKNDSNVTSKRRQRSCP